MHNNNHNNSAELASNLGLLAQDVPAKHDRPAFYDDSSARYQWHFCAIPTLIRRDGRSVLNPFRERAVYVVHGIGEQRLGDTAASFRLGFEDAVQAVEPQQWTPGAADNWVVPQPFIFDGYWGDYERIETMEPQLWARLTGREKDFFQLVWAKRAASGVRTYLWLIKAGVRLIHRGRGMARLYYCYLVPMLWLIVLVSWIFPRTRRFITGYLNDVRLYLDPQGDVEHVIVQRIDRLVAQRFLRLLGIKADFTDSDTPLCMFEGQPHRFQRITWVAHSLGTVISYNVIGDLLRRCLEIPPEDQERYQNARRIEESLEAFVTLGSPLDKVRFLFPEVLRDWPCEYLPGGERSLWGRADRPEKFWENFHYTSDPVSGPLDGFSCVDQATGEPHNLAVNWHTSGWRIPGLSHLDYWHDSTALARVLRLTFGSYVKDMPMNLRSGASQEAGLFTGAVFWMIALGLIVIGLVWWLSKQLGA